MATQNIFDLVDTWNSAPTTFTAIKMNVTDTASAAGSLLMDLQVGGSSRFSVAKNGTFTALFGQISPATSTGLDLQYTRAGISLGSAAPLNWTDGQPGAGTMDLQLHRDTADTLAQRRSTNPQTFRIYNTYTDASNYERGELRWNANNFELIATSAGTGATRSLRFGINNAAQWAINTSGHFVAVADNTYDIGASGANRPRDMYLGRHFSSAGYVFSSYLRVGNIGTEVRLYASSNGVAALYNDAETSFGRLQFGGTTNAFPALRRVSTSIEAVLADNTAYTDFNAANITAATGTAIPAGGTTGAGLKVSSTANFGVFFGSGAPTLSAAKGSLYLRSDGTTTNDRMYVNTNGSTTWTAVTTVA